jgi:DNA-binding transcriptional MerR regulator
MNVEIPNRSVFRAQEVCELADVQPYVLRTWEAEFPELGIAKAANGQRIYRRADVERVLRIKHMLFVDGLTLAGARRRMTEEGLSAPEPAPTDADVASMLDEETRQQLRDLRRGLQWILGVLSGHGLTAEDFVLTADPRRRGGSSTHRAAQASAASKPTARAAKVSKAARPVKKGKASKRK